MNANYDLIVIGSGPGGYVAAIRAAQLGFKTAIIEKEKLGGICLNWGCIPTKALLKSAELNFNLSKLGDFGISVNKPKYDWKKIISRTRKVASKLSLGVEYLLKKNKIEIINGTASIASQGKIVIYKDNKSYLIEAPNIIIATGAKSKSLQDLDLNNKNFWSYKEAMIPDKIPKKLLIIGAGAIGIEFASFYNDFGTEVTIVELQNDILPNEDEEISKLASKYFKKSGINIFVNSKILNIKSTEKEISYTIETKNKISETLTAEKVIIAVGVEGNIEKIGLENTSVKIKNGFIETNEYGATCENGIYAIGDVSGAPWLAHKASHEGIKCVEHISNPGKKIILNNIIPSCTYSRPQIASIGLTEKDAIKKGYEIKIGKFPLEGNGKAIAIGSKDGMVKTLFNKNTGELIGAHMIGNDVTELISGYCIAMQLEATEEELFNVVFPHPTISESLQESVLNAFDRSIHI